MDEVLLGSLIDKVDSQERKIKDIEKKVDAIPACEEVLNQIESGFKGLRTEVKRISFPEKEMFELSERLMINIGLLKRPVEQKIIQHHRVSKVVWITVVLFLALCVVSTGWFITYNNLSQYKANDTKYRYLKLVSNVSLSQRLRFIDSIYSSDPRMREFVIAKEEQKQRDFEVMQKTEHMEKYAGRPKNKGNKKEKKPTSIN